MPIGISPARSECACSARRSSIACPGATGLHLSPAHASPGAPAGKDLQVTSAAAHVPGGKGACGQGTAHRDCSDHVAGCDAHAAGPYRSRVQRPRRRWRGPCGQGAAGQECSGPRRRWRGARGQGATGHECSGPRLRSRGPLVGGDPPPPQPARAGFAVSHPLERRSCASGPKRHQWPSAGTLQQRIKWRQAAGAGRARPGERRRNPHGAAAT